VVHPNNPTGHATGVVERGRLEEICLRHGLALIVDEVFLDYPLGEEELTSFAVGPHAVLTFCLSGMSKIAGLSPMKVGWMVEVGWSAILRLPQMGGDVAEMLLRETGVVVHPGSFYGIAESGRVVVSLLGVEQEFAEGLERIVHGVKSNHGSY